MNVLVTTHGNFCKGLLESYEMIAGPNSAIFILSLTDDGIEAYANRLTVLVETLTKDNALIIMTDIKGGTPFNESYKLALVNPTSIQLLTGVNLPMLLETGLALTSQQSIEKLLEIGMAAGINAIESVIGKEMIDIEEDIEF